MPQLVVGAMGKYCLVRALEGSISDQSTRVQELLTELRIGSLSEEYKPQYTLHLLEEDIDLLQKMLRRYERLDSTNSEERLLSRHMRLFLEEEHKRGDAGPWEYPEITIFGYSLTLTSLESLTEGDIQTITETLWEYSTLHFPNVVFPESLIPEDGYQATTFLRVFIGILEDQRRSLIPSLCRYIEAHVPSVQVEIQQTTQSTQSLLRKEKE